MLLYLLALVIFGGSWYIFSKNLRNKKFNLYFSLAMLAVPILFHIAGLGYAAAIHSQGAALTSAFLAILLLLNSLIMVVVTVIRLAIRKRHKANPQ